MLATPTREERVELQEKARRMAYTMPLAQFHVGNPELFRTDTVWPFFERLRKESRSTIAPRARSASTGR